MFVFASFTSPVFGAAGINKTINFQGKIVNSDGTNVEDGSYDVAFGLYTAASGGSPTWTETWSSGSAQVSVLDGIFQVSLGAHTALPGDVDFNSDNIYLGVNFDGDGEMEPRIRLSAVPQAFNSDKVDGLDATQFIRSDASGNYTSGTLAFDSGTTLDIKGDLIVTDTGIVLDGVTTNFAATGDVSFNTDDLFIKKSDGSVGIGKNNPGTALDVNGTITGSQLIDSGLTSGRVTYATTDGLLTDSANLTFNGTALITTGLTLSNGGFYEYIYGESYISNTANRARGTSGSPTAVQANDILSEWANHGYDGTAYKGGAAIRFLAAEGYDSTHHAGKIQFYTNPSATEYWWSNSPSVVFDSTGNVGIGTTSPNAKLEIYTANTTLPGLVLRNTDNSNRATAAFQTLSNDGQLVLYSDSEVADIQLTAERDSYFKTGKVGIGTDAPTAGLHVNNSVAGDATNQAGLKITNTITGTNSYDVVGIGAQGLYIAPTVNNATNYNGIFSIPQLANAAVAVTNVNAINTYTGYGYNAGASVANATGLRVKSWGNTAPGTFTNQYGVYIENITGATNNYSIYTGTAPSSFGGAIQINGAKPAVYSGMWLSDESGYKLIQTYGEPLSLNGAGNNVGIGTTSPRRVLDVLDGSGSPQERLTYTDNSVYTDLETDSTGAYWVKPTGSTIAMAGNINNWTWNLPGASTTSQTASMNFNPIYSNPAGRTVTAKIDFNRPSTTDGEYPGLISFWTRTNGSAIAERMRIDQAGNVGIGTTSPAGKLQVNGRVILGGSDTLATWSVGANTGQNAGRGSDGNAMFVYSGVAAEGRSGVMIGDSTGGYGFVQAGSQSSGGGWTNRNLVLQNEGGNVGIGTTSPERLLDVGSSSASAAGRFGTWGSVGGTSSGEAWWGSNFYINGTTIKSLNTHATLGYAGIFTTWAASGSALNFITSGGASTKDATITPTTRMVIDYSGKVGIGTSPTAPLTIKNNSTTEQLNIFYNTQYLYAGANSSNYVTLGGYDTENGALNLVLESAGGNVGIGTTSPAYKLDVNGTMRVSQLLSFTATGGTKTTSGDYTVHTFTSSGTFTPSGPGTVEYLVVGGGGGGGKDYAGGGGAGGFRTGSMSVSGQGYTVTVGNGGAGGTSGTGTSGESSVFGSVTSAGGGGGAGKSNAAGSGASGGGGNFQSLTAGTGTVGQGNNGGDGSWYSNAYLSGGGGGAGSVGGTGTAYSSSGAGGSGTASSISGSSVTYAGGGGGGGFVDYGIAAGTATGGGGAGGYNHTQAGANGTANTGGGGGGGAGDQGNGGNGGSGIVIVRYLTAGSASESIVANGTNVGIGTATPTNAKLVVLGSVAVGADELNNAFSTGSLGTGSTTMYIGNSTINVTAPSDISTKENIVSSVYGLADLMKFSVKEFTYKKEFVDEGETQKQHTGMIAQDVEAIFPEAVIYRSDGLKAIDYTKLIPLIVRSIQDLSTGTTYQSLATTTTTTTGKVLGASTETNSLLSLETDLTTLLKTKPEIFGMSMRLFNKGYYVTQEDLKSFIISGTIVVNDVDIKGILTLSNKQAGFALIPEKGKEVEIVFEKPMKSKPIVSIMMEGDPEAYGLYDVSEKGFTVRLAKSAGRDITFSWLAVIVKDSSVSKGKVLDEEPEEPTATPTPVTEQVDDPTPTPIEEIAPSPSPEVISQETPVPVQEESEVVPVVSN